MGRYFFPQLGVNSTVLASGVEIIFAECHNTVVATPATANTAIEGFRAAIVLVNLSNGIAPSTLRVLEYPMRFCRTSYERRPNESFGTACTIDSRQATSTSRP